MANGDDETPSIVRRLISNELGRSGLVRMDGTIYEEFLPSLRGIQGVRKYREMSENSAVVAAIVFAIESLLRSVEWYVEPASDSAEDAAAAEFLDQCRIDMSHTWEDFMAEVLSMLVYGWSYFEIVYKQRVGPTDPNPRKRSRYTDGRVGWRKFAPRSQDTLWKWQFDNSGGIQGMWQELPLDISDPGAQRLVYLPIEKSLLFRTTSRKNNPEGRSLLRGAYRAAYFAKRLEEVEALGAERDLAGMPIAYVPPEVLAVDRTAEAEATYNTIKDVVTRVKRDEQEGIIFPLAYDEKGNPIYKFELLSAPSRRQFDVGSIIMRYTQNMAMSMLADFMLLGHEKVGSFALSSEKTELFAVAMGAFLDTIEKTINRHAVPRLFELNSFTIDQPPELRHGDIEQPNLTELGSYITSVTSAGFLPGKDYEMEAFVRHAADFPKVTAEEYQERLDQEEEKAQQAFDRQQQLAVQSSKAEESPSTSGSNPGSKKAPRPPRKSAATPPPPKK